MGVRVPPGAPSLRKGGRVVYGSGLENQRRLTPTVGSNPTPSATTFYYAMIDALETVAALATRIAYKIHAGWQQQVPLIRL